MLVVVTSSVISIDKSQLPLADAARDINLLFATAVIFAGATLPLESTKVSVCAPKS